MSRKKLLILIRKKFLSFSFFIFFVFPFITFSTIPQSQDSYVPPSSIFEKAKSDFLSGNLNSAYKNFLLTNFLKENPNWRELYFLTLVGLNKPYAAISFLQEQKKPTEKEKFYIETLIQRQGVEKGNLKFSEILSFPIPKEISKKIFSILENKDNYFVLTQTALYKINNSGKIVETNVFTGGKELFLDENGEVAVLTNDGFLLNGRKISFPFKIKSALSIAKAPEGNFYVLGENNELFKVNKEGKIIEERQLLIKKCLKIRTDSLFRVFILSSNGEISVYSASFEPLFVIDGNSSATALSGIKEFFVDYAGNPIILDKSGELFFFNFHKDFLGKSQKKKIRAKQFYWDGGKYLFLFDNKKVVLEKLEL